MLRLRLQKDINMVSQENYPEEFVKFLNASPTPYHAVHNIKAHLLEHNFEELQEEHSWVEKLKRGRGYFVTRNDSAIVAFVLGEDYDGGNPFAIIGAHTDSPVLKIKPISKRSNEKFDQVGVECYGGGIWHSWFDSDLSIAGRVIYKSQDHLGEVLVTKLVDLKKPLLKIPTLAIHLDRTVNEKFVFDKEYQLLPVAGLTAKQADKDCSECTEENSSSETFFSIKSVVERHHRDLVNLVAKELHIESEQIEDFELTLYDHQPSCLGGLHDEFVFSGRLDNLTSCFTSMHALTSSIGAADVNQECARMMACFDHEEIGSASAQGADSNFLPSVLERIAALKQRDHSYYRFQDMTNLSESYRLKLATRKSFFLSSDVAHSVHPNYASKHESNHKPVIGGGPVVKINANQRYMTNSPGLVLVKALADSAKVPLQLIVVANNSPCGSTIGPIIASKTGIPTLDLGNPVLSMHSIRETGGSDDLASQIKLFTEFYKKGTKMIETGYVRTNEDMKQPPSK
ncbi:LADA_0B03180g1_1 [Lachancea dasiensis]|uniref:aspartyl aminopeptidase n=1 Tax=Lachancea dasiensis TaxID=1072105 RepID=A0A1G4ISK7_9SACH|nr:LADA_0B03180g1_1 [Lachancea dasiensis]